MSATSGLPYWQAPAILRAPGSNSLLEHAETSKELEEVENGDNYIAHQAPQPKAYGTVEHRVIS